MPASEREDDDEPQSTSGFQRWLLLDGSRSAVAGVTALTVLLTTVLFGRSSLAPLEDVQPLFYLFSGLLGGNLTVITVVVSINQLLLSQELSTPGTLRSQMEGVIEYRRDAESGRDRVAPVEPEGFLRYLYDGMADQARELADAETAGLDRDASDQIRSIVAKLTDRAATVDDLLEESGTSTFEVLSVTLTTNYATEIMDLRQVKWNEDIDEDVADDIDEVVHHLENIDVARQYFKSVYLKEELAVLSRNLFYVGIPSVVAVGLGLLVLTASNGAAIPRSQLELLVPVLFTVGLLPLCFLFAFVLRVATVTQRTAAKIPFTTPV